VHIVAKEIVALAAWGWCELGGPREAIGVGVAVAYRRVEIPVTVEVAPRVDLGVRAPDDGLGAEILKELIARLHRYPLNHKILHPHKGFSQHPPTPRPWPLLLSFCASCRRHTQAILFCSPSNSANAFVCRARASTCHKAMVVVMMPLTLAMASACACDSAHRCILNDTPSHVLLALAVV